MAPPVVRPDNVLKRAEELITVGKEESALQVLHEFITSKKTRSVAPVALEPIANLFVELSVNLRKGFTLKDGLHQFKKNVQVASNGLESVEAVSRNLIQLAEKKLDAAQAKADARAVTSVEDDLEAGESPEDVLLSAVSSEQSRDRADRELVTPWLRFLWESFRLVLDLLRNNSRLEVAYAAVVQQAFQFSLSYNRKTEFKRLCEMLRAHIQYATTQQKSGTKHLNAIDLQDPETLQRYLDLRFSQLNASVKLELWQEAFRSVEDIHTLINVSKRPVKPTMMVSYYENLAKIFLVADNGLFHAAAWHKFFNLYSQSPNATEEELTRFSSIFALATLSISRDHFNVDVSENFNRYSNNHLASLLNLPKVPTRESLIQYALNKNVYDFVDPSVKKLFDLLETNFHPLSIRDDLNEVIANIENNEIFAPYIRALTKVILTRLFEQVSQVYETVKLDFLIQLATLKGKFEVSPLEIESLLLNAGKNGELSFYIDHDAGVITFRSDPFEEASSPSSGSLQTSPADLVRSQLSNLAKTLYASVKYTDPSYLEKQNAIRERLLASAAEALAKERKEIEKSRELLAQRKEQAEKEKKEREAEAIRIRQQRVEEEKAAAAERAEAEAKRRIQEKIQREQDAVKEQEKQALIKEINQKGIIKLDADQLEGLDADKLRVLQIEQLEKDKKDLEERLQSQFKKIDHTERAYRKYELPMLAKDALVQKEEDLKHYEVFKNKRITAAKKEHEEALQLRDRLSKIVSEYNKFRDEIDSEAAARIEALRKEKAAELEKAKQARIEAVRQQRYQEALAKYEVEKEREAQRAKEEAEAKAKAEADEKKRAELQKLREEREATNSRLDAQAAKQREVEAMIEAKQRAARSGASPAAPSPSPAPAAGGERKMTYAEKMRLKRSSAFTVVQNDLSGNVTKIRTRLLATPDKSATLQDLVLNELADKKSKTATQGLLWLSRGLQFTAQALRETIDNPGSELSKTFTDAYNKTLVKYHSFVVKPVFKLAMKACPYRKDFFEKLGADQTKVLEQLTAWLEALENIVKIIFAFYESGNYGKGL
ncbi:translation initiation factor eIF-3 subunit [Wickerhamomyces ciferrii]|uniref:Eukaryotic translation initiation factor 3 subunit A n=1 Tax=Wickerhamomyces ciferrii (strain ATCC 14091 / BCRC 22168 / CBS 111 / JCM 3599 / NBRC 0793 / NRRL Y-1031 F-60-10) TaxID=1206466 RepID=K0KKS6_WICCF|nr:translation initiation factor eIF-3 subunit [Wickerhamomyces ciferrii]CCH45790.1 translation initiation factor eIF-3 subunit [Wickerhamomyces ciferrii]